MTSVCVHKTYTEDKALAKWARLAKARRQKSTIYQCRKCLGWRVLPVETVSRLLCGDYEQEPNRPKGDDLLVDYRIRLARAAKRLPFTKKQIESFAKRIGITIQEAREALAAVQLSKKAAREQAERFATSEALHARPFVKPPKKPEPPKQPRPFARRPRRAARALAAQTMAQLLPDWVITPEQQWGYYLLHKISGEPKDKPNHARVLEATRFLGPFKELPAWLQLQIARMGIVFPRTVYGRIPLIEALYWEKKGTGKTYYDCLRAAAKRWQDGEDYVHTLWLWLENYDKSDLRQTGMHFGKDGVRSKSQRHRVRTHNPDKPNRFRKFTTRSLKHYWRWLLDHLKGIAKAQGRMPENYVLPASENLTADYDGDRSRRRKKPAKPRKGKDY